MSITKEQILDVIAEMSVMDIVELISMMEKKFGVSAPTAVTTAVGASPEATIEEKTEFNIFLHTVGTNKIAVIKAVRGITGLGLKEAKDLVESAPVILKEGISKEESENLKKVLEEIGASVEIN